MKLKLLKISIFSLCITTVLFNGIFAEKEHAFKSFVIVPAQETPIKTIIFDLGDVLIAPSRTIQTTLFINIALQHPSIIYILAKQNIKFELFNMLNNIPASTNSTDQVMYNQGKLMPQIMVDWQTGYPVNEICAKTLSYLATSDYSSSQKILFSKIIQLIFQPTKLIQTLRPIESMVQVAYGLKKHGYKLYILSNWDAESFPLLTQKYANLFNIFDGIMISGAEGIGKPNPLFYINLLNKYNLNPHECAFIDDEPYNIATACDLGIHGVLNDSFNSTCFQLKKLGILQPIQQ